MQPQNYKNKSAPTIGADFLTYLYFNLFTSQLGFCKYLIQLLKVELTISYSTYYCILTYYDTPSRAISIRAFMY